MQDGEAGPSMAAASSGAGASSDENAHSSNDKKRKPSSDEKNEQSEAGSDLDEVNEVEQLAASRNKKPKAR